MDNVSRAGQRDGGCPMGKPDMLLIGQSSGQPSLMPHLKEFEWQDQDFRFLARLFQDKTGIVLTEKKRAMLYSRLMRRLRAVRVRRFSDYCAYLQGPDGGRELDRALNAITTNTTRFFREGHHFDYLRDQILPAVCHRMDEAAADPFRVWSAGCSSGEEAYSIAMVVRWVLGERAEKNSILATDLNSSMLAQARAATYAAEKTISMIPPDYWHFFHRENLDMAGPQFGVKDEIRTLVYFRKLNLLHHWPMTEKFDIIFCRNVMMYFDRTTQDKLIRRFADFLKPGGFLFIGHAENLSHAMDIYKAEGRTIYKRLS